MSKNSKRLRGIPSKLQVIGIEYKAGEEYNSEKSTGDFRFMFQDRRLENALFIFNDNSYDMDTDKEGGGNAVLRKYAFTHPSRVLGIPTGSRFGWQNLFN